MKKKLLFSIVALASGAMAVGAFATQKTAQVKADETTGWTCVSGGRAISKEGDTVTLTTDAWAVQHQKDDKVYLNGMSVTVGQSGVGSNSITGFFFTGEEATAFAYAGITFNTINRADWGQMRLIASGDHDPNTSVSYWYPSMEATSPGCGGQASPQIVCNYATDCAYNYAFARVNTVWWSVTISEVEGTGGIWSDTANFSNKAATLYFKDADMDLGEDGSGYMQVFGLSGAVTIRDFVNGTAWSQAEGPDKDSAALAINGYVGALNSFNYTAENWNVILGLQTQALEDLEAATAQDEVDLIVDTFKDDVDDVPTLAWEATDDWACTYGAYEARIPQEFDNMYKFNTDAWLVTYTTAEKVTLDGLSFDFGGLGLSNGSQDGFFFSDSAAPTTDAGMGFQGATVSLWKERYSGQDRLGIYTSHDDKSGLKCYTSMEGTTAGFGGAAESLVLHSENNPDILNFKFEHVKKAWYKLTITETEYSSISHNSANASTNDAGKKTTFVYLKTSDLPLDENGAAYLNVFGFSGHAIVRNLVDGEYRELPEEPATTEEIATLKAKVNEICANYREGFMEIANGLKQDALDAIDELTLLSEMEEVVETLRSDIKAAYLEYLGYGVELESNDACANFTSVWGQAVYGSRLNDEGGAYLALQNVFGARGDLIRTYDPLNFEMLINVSTVANDTALQINFDTVAGSYASETASKYFHLEFLMRSGYAHAVLGTGAQHNVSIDEWNTKNDNTYTGTPVTINNSGDILIKFATDVATNKTTVTINDKSVVVDTPVLNRGADASETPSVAHVQIGCMNNSGYTYVRLDKMEDAASKEYAEGISDVVEAAEATIASTKTTVLGLYNSETAGDTEYAAYKEAYDTAVTAFGSFALTSYDYNYYLKATVEAALELMRAPQADYAEKVEAAKADVVSFLDEYDEDDYREDEQALLAAAKADVLEQLEGAETLTKVATIKANAKITLDAIKTNAQYEAEEALAAAKEEAYKVLNAKLDEAPDECITDVARLISEGKTAIAACTSIEDVNATLADYVARIDAVIAASQQSDDSSEESSEPVSSEEESSEDESSEPETSEPEDNPEPEEPAKKGCGGSIIATSSLIALISIAGVSFLASKKKED